MQGIDGNYALVIIGIIAIAVEIILGAATGFDLLIIGIIFMISGALGWLIKSFYFSIGSVIVLSFFYIAVARALIKSKLSIETKTTNTDRLIGKKGLVIKKIAPHKPGQVKIDSEIWRAESDAEILEGKEVEIKSVSGITLKVL